MKSNRSQEVTVYDPNFNYREAVKQQQETQSSNKAVYNDEQDTNKWEIDYDPLFEALKHQLMGEYEERGEWQRDDNMPKRMNERGANILIMEVKSRIHKALALSEIDDGYINDVCLNCAYVISDQVANRWQEFGMMPYESEFSSVCNMIIDNLHACLNTAKGGAMKIHRERAKHPMVMPGATVSQQVGGSL